MPDLDLNNTGLLAIHQNNLERSEDIPLPEPYSKPKQRESPVVVPKLGYVKLLRIY